MDGKLDLKKQMKALYAPPTKDFVRVDVPPIKFLMIDGAGDPNHALEYKLALEALYSLAYTLKFNVKKKQGIDFAVMPLEGLWWTEDMAQFSVDRKDEWLWTMMIAQPDFISQELVDGVCPEVRRKKDVPALEKIRLETFHEGPSLQIMHIGPYSAEGPTLARMHALIREQGMQLIGKHHEIYLSDPNRTAPENMKTVLRQPFGDRP
jgi:hypothetical protein